MINYTILQIIFSHFGGVMVSVQCSKLWVQARVVTNHCLTPSEQFFSNIMARLTFWWEDDDVNFVLYLSNIMARLTFWWEGDDVHFVLYQLSWIFIMLACWNNSLTVDILLRHIILILSQSLLLLYNAACLVQKQQIPIS